MNRCKAGSGEKSELVTCINCEEVKQIVLDSLNVGELPIQIEVSDNPGRFVKETFS